MQAKRQEAQAEYAAMVLPQKSAVASKARKPQEHSPHPSVHMHTINQKENQNGETRIHAKPGPLHNEDEEVSQDQGHSEQQD